MRRNLVFPRSSTWRAGLEQVIDVTQEMERVAIVTFRKLAVAWLGPSTVLCCRLVTVGFCPGRYALVLLKYSLQHAPTHCELQTVAIRRRLTVATSYDDAR